MFIEVENLNKTFRKYFKKIQVLKNINLNVEDNQILGVAGPNGAGKTTLMKILAGIISGDKNSGKIKICGNGDRKLAKSYLGFLPENFECLKNVTVFELLKFSIEVSNTEFTEERVDEVLEFVDLLNEKEKKLKEFSQGPLRRIGLAQAIIHSPQILILDEPLFGLDLPDRRMVVDLINRYFRAGKTILFSTRNLEDIEALCTNVIVLNKGKILLDESLLALREKSYYRIEVDVGGKIVSYKVKSQSKLWRKLDEIRIKEIKILKIKSGIIEQLEKYYEK